MTKKKTATTVNKLKHTEGGSAYDPTTVHYHRRKLDDNYEVVARAQIVNSDYPGDTEWRWVAIDVQPNRVKALESVKQLRGHA